MFESVVVVTFQSAFRAEMHQNNIFLFFLKLFLRSAQRIKTIQNIKKILIFNKKKLNFYRTQFTTFLNGAKLHLNLNGGEGVTTLNW